MGITKDELKHNPMEICFAVTGGIAIYKSLDVISALRKLGYDIHVFMTPHATQFVSPTTFAGITTNRVFIDQFDSSHAFPHLELVHQSAQFVICPATYNIVGKIAGGIADDLVSTTAAAAFRRRILCPAMNMFMYENPIYLENQKKLRDLGWEVIPPQIGTLACGYEGPGKLASVDTIVEKISQPPPEQLWKGTRFLITAGATREKIDPIRYITNRSSGKMGVALCQEAIRQGASVTLIHGHMEVSAPSVDQVIQVESAIDMYEAVAEQFDSHDVLIMAAAVADYRVTEPSNQKIKKHNTNHTLELTRNPDILTAMGKRKTHQRVIGFAAETEQLRAHAQAKLKQKNLDMIVANDVGHDGHVFGSDSNQVVLLGAQGWECLLETASKREIASGILREMAQRFRSQ